MRPAYMPAISTLSPGTTSQNVSLIGQTAASGRRVATGRSCTEAPITVVVSTPSANRWTAASAGPKPPRNPAVSPAPVSSTSHIRAWNAAALTKNRNGTDAGSSLPLAPARKVAAIAMTASCAPGGEAQLHAILAGRFSARGSQDFVAPSAIVELGIEEDRLAIEVGDQRGIDFAAVDHAKDRDHRLRRFQPAQVDVSCLGHAPQPRAVIGSPATHAAASLRAAPPWCGLCFV